MYAAGGVFTAIFKSTDQGENWTEIEVPVGGTSDLFSLTIDPKNGGVLWAATEDGLLKSDRRRRHLDAVGPGHRSLPAEDGRDRSARPVASGGGRRRRRDLRQPRRRRELVAVEHGAGRGLGREALGRPAQRHACSRSWRPASTVATAPSWTEITEPFASGEEADLDGFVFDASVAADHLRPRHLGVLALDRRRQALAEGGAEGPGRAADDEGLDRLGAVREHGAGPRQREDHLRRRRGRTTTPTAPSTRPSTAARSGRPSGTGLPAETVAMLRAGAPGTVFALVEGQRSLPHHQRRRELVGGELRASPTRSSTSWR